MSADMSVFAAGNVAVISGSSSGIGLGMARKCAEAGMHVYLVDRDEQALAAAERQLRECGAQRKVIPSCCSVSLKAGEWREH